MGLPEKKNYYNNCINKRFKSCFRSYFKSCAKTLLKSGRAITGPITGPIKGSITGPIKGSITGPFFRFIRSFPYTTGTGSYFVFLIIFMATLCIQTGSVSAAPDESAIVEGSASIIDFFSDNNLSDATVRFDQPLENISLVFTLSSENKVLKSETFLLNHVEKGQEATKVVFWGVKEDFGQEKGKNKDKESYSAQLFVNKGSEILDSRNLSFSYRSPILSNFKVIDFSADSEKASTLITLKSSTDLGSGLNSGLGSGLNTSLSTGLSTGLGTGSSMSLSSVQATEPSVIDLNLKLLSGTEVIYSENQENIPLTGAYYKPIYWPFILEKDRMYTALLKVHSHSPDLTSVYRSDFKAEEKVEIVDKDVRVDEYGASVTLIGRSQVPFDGTVKVVLTPETGEAKKVFEETADILTSGREDTLGIIWQGISKGDYNVKIYAVDREGEIIDSYETALRVIEPVAAVTPAEKSPTFGFLGALGVFLFLCIFSKRKER